MSNTELDTFVQKFYHLWNAGHTAHLDIYTHAGKAWVGLCVHLGHAPGPLHHQPQYPLYQAQKKTVKDSVAVPDGPLLDWQMLKKKSRQKLLKKMTFKK